MKMLRAKNTQHRSKFRGLSFHVDWPLVLFVRPGVVRLLYLLASLATDCLASYEMQGPSFIIEPPSRVEFTNANGGKVDCMVRGNPEPTVDWLAADGGSIANIPGSRLILGNGTIHFLPFEAEAFRQDVHWAIYKCSAVNSVGAIVSRDVNVRAVVNQRYDPEVQSQAGFPGNNILMRCSVPSFVRDHVTVTSWLQEPSFNIYPSIISDGKYHMLPSGELMIINITRNDIQATYRCRTHHRITQETVISTNIGRVQLTEIRGFMPPIINEKILFMSARVDDTVVIPCVAYANPQTSNRWYFKKNQRDEPIEHSDHYGIQDGNLIIQGVQENDGGLYLCTAANSEGSETLEVTLTISAPLSVHVQPAIQTVDLHKPAHLTCIASGFPQAALYWMKDGQPLRMGVRVKISENRISVMSVAREDRGMYQCFVRNEYEMSQGIAELRLGEIAPQLVSRFIEQTMQPGPSVSLKCSATGNPTPQISWLLDGFPLPQNDRLLIGQYVTVYGDVISHVNITSVTPEDGGEYECTAGSRAGEAKHSARLNIYGPLSIRPMPTVSAVAGKALKIKCPVAGYPIESITWEKDAIKLPTNMRQRVANGTLFIDTIQSKADHGIYTCTARNKNSITSQRTVEVRVLVPPKITPFAFARDLNVGDRTSIQCVVVTGDLPLTFTWLKDNVPIEGDQEQDAGGPGQESSHGHSSAENINMPEMSGSRPYGTEFPRKAITIRQYDAFNSALSISTIAPAQNGTYTCRVSNGAATVAHSALLHVNVPPRISPFYFGSGVMEGMRTQLMCTTSQGDQPFNITWLMDDKPIQVRVDDTATDQSNSAIEANAGIQISDYPPFSSILTINSVSARHSGNYTCQIRNVAGLAEHSTSLLVAVPPKWTVEPMDQNAVVDHGISIACQAEGFPAPTVTWKQSIGETPGDYRELGYSSTEGIGVVANGTLVISRVSRDNAGFYLCQASNGIGPGLSKLIRLTVHAGPRVSVRSRQETVRRGGSVTLHCEAEGDTPLDLSWRARGSRIDPNYDVRYSLQNSATPRGMMSELRISQADHVDHGEYFCNAGNAYGHDKASVNLLVQEPPNFPRNVHVAEQGSRSILIAWNSPMSESDSSHSNPPVTSYIIQYKEAQDVWHEHNMQKLVTGDTTVALVSPLKPATPYHFRVLAENHLGTSAPSDILHAQTDGEIPGGAPKHVSVEPLDPQQLKVTWQPPDRSLWNGELLGYTISYTNLGEHSQSVNVTRVGISGNSERSCEYRLTGLQKYTQYNIIVKAFNAKGDGPGSDPIVAQTFEDVPSAPPQNVICTALTGQNIQVTWKPPPSDKVHGVIQGYKLLYESSSDTASIVETSRETKITHALSTVLHGLSPYTNYTVQVFAYTRAGDGVSSSPVTCTTEETIPDAPERVKAVAGGEDMVVISWLPPRQPNGIITKYIVYIRVLEQGQEVKITKSFLTAQNLHHEAAGLKLRESYEAWVTASTKVGQGPSTPVIKLQPSSTVPAAIVSFGTPIVVPWKVDVNMDCLIVGVPLPTLEWRHGDLKLNQNSDIGPHNTLLLKSVQRSHEGNYSCHVKNSFGHDEITYTLQVQVPPTPPTLLATGTTNDAVQLQWKQGDNGGAPIKGFLLAYRREFAEWEEVFLDRRDNTHLLEGLQCGTKYQFTLAAFNRIGSGSASKVETARTNGSKPIPPPKQHLIKANLTFALLDLTTWQDGGCPLLYFVVEYRRIPGDWLLASNNVPPHTKFPIVNLESDASYEVRVTAYNNAGSSQRVYLFNTLSTSGNTRLHGEHPQEVENTPLYLDAHVLTPSVISLLAIVLAVAGVCFCLKSHPDRRREPEDSNSQNQAALDNKHNMEQREQYYATVRKSGQESPRRDSSLQDRIHDYSEDDIYPYATFHLPEQENLSANPMRQSYIYERNETMLQSAQVHVQANARDQSRPLTTHLFPLACDVEQYTKLRGRSRRKLKSFKSESEEYDTLGSDSDTEMGTSSRTESSNQLEDCGPGSIIAQSPGRNCGNQREQRLALVPRPVHHNVLYHTHESSTSTEPSPISERKTFPRIDRQKVHGTMPNSIMDSCSSGILQSILKIGQSSSAMRPFSRNGSPSLSSMKHGSCDKLGNEQTLVISAFRSSSRKSLDPQYLLKELNVRDSEFPTLKLKPPTGFMDAHESSETERDLHPKLKLHRQTADRTHSYTLSRCINDVTRV